MFWDRFWLHFGSPKASLLAPFSRPKSIIEWIQHRLGLQVAQQALPDRPRPPQERPKTSQEPPRRPQDAQKCSQEAPKTAPTHQKMIPRGPTYSQERLKTAPQAHGNGIAGRASSSASPRGDHQSWGSGRCFRRRRTRSGRFPRNWLCEMNHKIALLE